MWRRVIIFLTINIAAVLSIKENTVYNTNTFSSSFTSSNSDASFSASEFKYNGNDRDGHTFGNPHYNEDSRSYESKSEHYNIWCEHKKGPQCGCNEEYVKCKDSICRPQTCSDLGIPLACQQPTTNADCKESTCKQGSGCVCKEGYVRNDNGLCISDKQCPSCGGDSNAQPGCGVFCTTCDNYNQSVACIDICFINACDCKEGYIYDTERKKCVLPGNCSPKKCNKPNEIEGCKNACPPRTCEAKDRVYKCPPQAAVCIPECVCKAGFYRNSAGDCVTKEQCSPKKCTKPNEIEGCKNECPPRVCETRFKKLFKCPPRPAVCETDCVCKPGFFRNSAGDCVTEKQCSAPKCSGPNEVYERAASCPPQTCSSINKRYNCPLINTTNETFQCRCKPGYYRNKINECISKEDCLKCTGPNEFFSCGGACDNVCAELSKRNQTNCDIVNIKCNPKCYCEEKYARDSDGKCIPIESCPVCPPNEELVPCPEAVCRPSKCSEVGFPVNCPDLKSCPSKPACICSEGYVRDNTGTCIPVRQCPSCGGDENAWSGCGVKCNTCAGTRKICPRICIPNSCDCKPGYLYDNNLNKCVPSDKCTPTCGPNEVYSNCTNRACHKSTCAQLAIPTVCRFYTNGSLSPDPSCIGGCECASGYLRDSNNTCVPEDQCSKAQCGVNEEYVENPVCRPKTCSDLGYPLSCLQLNSETTSNQGPGCICKDGYIRDGNGTCISDRECPSCGGDVNARSGCGTFCTTCDNYGESVACILSCILNGCDCKEGYVYNKITKQCVLPESCPPKKCNKPNEIEGCKNACPPRTCEAKDKVYKCPPQAAVCIPECVCKSGFYRNSAGDCVTKEQCSPKKCNKPNEIEECKNACPPRTCEANDRVYECLL